MKYIEGDLIELFKNGEFAVIIHGCNCKKKMKSGIAGQLAKQYPRVSEEDNLTNDDFEKKLGSFSFLQVERQGILDGTIINAYTQLDYGRDPNIRYVSYVAVKKAFKRISSFLVNFQDCFGGQYKIGIPKIGCGLGNGDWSIISKIIEEETKGLDITVVEYDKNKK